MLALIALLCFANQISPVTPWPHQHIGKIEGLSNSSINTIYKDKDEFIWLGTWDGLDKYNGSNILIYKPTNNSRTGIGLSNNIIRSIVEDKEGNLWVSTHRGVNKYIKKNNQFENHFTHLDSLPLLEYTTRIALDADSVACVNIVGQGLYRYRKENNTFQFVRINGLSLKWLEGVEGMSAFRGINYMLSGNGELAAIAQNNLLFKKNLCESTELIYHAFVQLKNQPYIVIVTKSGWLKMYNLTSLDKPVIEKSCRHNPITCATSGKERIWLGTEKGEIFKISFEQDGLTYTDMTPYMPHLVSAKRKILCITETNQDILWVGVDGDGAYKFLMLGKAYYSISDKADSKPRISNSIVRSIFEDSSGTLYVGTRGGGLNIISPTKELKLISTSNGLSNNTIYALRKDREGCLWIGLEGEGIDMMDKKGKFFHFPQDFVNKPDITFGNVYSILQDYAGNIWLGTSGYGIIKMNISQVGKRYVLKSFQKINIKTTQNLKSNVVYSIAEEKPSIIWFGTRGAGIYKFNSITNKIDTHINSEGSNQLSNDDVLALYIDSQHQLWVGTSGGLNKVSLHATPYSIVQYSQKEGLLNNTIHGIQESTNRIFLSTNTGLTIFTPTSSTFKTYDRQDGLINTEYTDGASYKSTLNGNLYFGGINGMDIIYPEKFSTNTTFPRIALTNFKVYNINKSSHDQQSFEIQADDLSDIFLKYNQNFISFSFTTLDYWDNRHINYMYFLENFDKSWNEIGSQNNVNLTNISPGTYKLYINYKKFDEPNPTPKVITLHIANPFWKTGWAYFLYTLVFLLMQTGLIVFIRERAKRKRAIGMEKLKLQQLQELNDYKLQFFTNIAHEFRTPLTLIFGPVTLLIKKAQTEWEKMQLKTIYTHSLRLQKLIEELLHFRKIESGKDTLLISEIELVQFTEEIIDSFKLHASDHHVHLEFIPQIDKLVGWIDVQKVEKILVNLISNAIKYNNEGGSVDIMVREENKHVLFIVRDTGIGINENRQEKIFQMFYQNPQAANPSISSTGIGLSLSRSLATLHHGSITLISSENKGATFTVKIPITKDAYSSLEISTNRPILEKNLAEKISLEFKAKNEENWQEINGASEQNENKKTILAIDDNDEILQLLRQILSDQYLIRTANDSITALQILDKEKIDLVISDVMMPESSGLLLCKNIKDDIRYSHIPVILLTARTEIEDRIQGLQVGADSYIPKPFHPEHLFIRIEKLLQNREQIRRSFENLFGKVQEVKWTTGLSHKDDLFFIKIKDSISVHLNDPDFTADIMATEVGLSKGALYKKVKAVTDYTPHGLIKQYRLQKAADLLVNTNLTVSEVIYETGFNSRSYFYKSFNETYNCHPKDYKEKILQESKQNKN